MLFSGDDPEQSLHTIPAACRTNGDVIASRLYLDGVLSPTPSRFLSVYASILKILLALHTLACSGLFHINCIIPYTVT